MANRFPCQLKVMGIIYALIPDIYTNCWATVLSELIYDYPLYDHALKGLFNFFGIETLGLTAGMLAVESMFSKLVAEKE